MASDQAPGGAQVQNHEDEDDDRRRRFLLWLLLALILLLFLVFVRSCGSEGDDESSVPPGGDGASADVGSVTVAPTEPAPTTTDAPEQPAPTEPPAPTIDGVWSMTIDVSVATGACAGEETETAVPDTVTFTSDGNALEVLGLGNPVDEQIWSGTVDGTVVTFGGERNEDDGVTAASFTLEVDFDSMVMTGREDWDWTGPGGTCPGSRSDVTATRLSG